MMKQKDYDVPSARLFKSGAYDEHASKPTVLNVNVLQGQFIVNKDKTTFTPHATVEEKDIRMPMPHPDFLHPLIQEEDEFRLPLTQSETPLFTNIAWHEISSPSFFIPPPSYSRDSTSPVMSCSASPEPLNYSYEQTRPSVQLIKSYEGCRSCEAESNKLYECNNKNRPRNLLPDYSRLDILSFESDPGFIDTHCHLDFLFTRQNYNDTYANYRLKHKESYPATYEGCVAVFCNPLTFPKKFMWQKYLAENGVWGAFGCHPHRAALFNDVLESALGVALRHSKVRALGEIGLDYSSRNDCSKEIQHDVFKRQLKIAVSRRLPLVIHCRDANEDCMKIMKEYLPRNWIIHLHCFTDSWDWAQKWLKEFPNLYIGITNLVTYSSARKTHEVAQKIPLDRLLLETDSPYFVPRMAAKGTSWSHPGMAIHVAAQIATLRDIGLKQLLFATRSNTYKMYGI